MYYLSQSQLSPTQPPPYAGIAFVLRKGETVFRCFLSQGGAPLPVGGGGGGQ